MKRTCFATAVLTGALVLFVLGGTAGAHMILLDGKLEVNGYLKEQIMLRRHIPKDDRMFHESNFDFARTSFLCEALYKLVQTPDLTVNLFGGFRYYYEKMPALDEEFDRAIPHREYDEYVHPRDDDLLTEAYVDISKGPFQFRIGKQIVVWGETDIKRTADVINPLDVRYGSPGTEDWETLKLGLYMIRGFYQTDLPGQLLLEFLFIPGDFEPARVPVEGTHYGPRTSTSSFNPGKGPGMYHWMQEKARRDARGWNIRNYEFGFKVRGYTWNVDWALFYFNTLADSPTARPARQVQLAYEYVGAGLRSLATGGHIRPKMPGYKVFHYKRYEVLGGTAQTIIDRLHGSEWRLEWFYEIGNHFNKAPGGLKSGMYYGETRRDTAGGGLTYADRFDIPYFTRRICDNKKLTVSFSVFYEKMFNHDRDIVIQEDSRGRRPCDSHATTFTWSVSQNFCHSQWLIMFTGSYNPIGKYFLCPIISYAPGSHWRWELALPVYGSKCSVNKGLYDRDSALIRIRYEF